MFIVAIDEDGQVAGHKEVVQLTLRLADALERAEALQMGTSHVGNKATGGFSRLYQRLDITRMRGAHLHNGNICILV